MKSAKKIWVFRNGTNLTITVFTTSFLGYIVLTNFHSRKFNHPVVH